jgi:uncharacterized protein (TIGR00369 family)
MDRRYGNSSLPILRQQSHPECFVCGSANGHGLGLEFCPAADGAVEAAFACEPVFAGYPGMLHGGIICSLLDGAMTNCMFAHGLAAITFDMNVRFRHPVGVSRPATVRARLNSDADSSVHHLTAEVVQEGQVVATATARFIDKEALSWFAKRAP